METDATKARPRCALAVHISAEAVRCGIASCLSCDTEFCWKCKKVRAVIIRKDPRQDPRQATQGS